MFGFYIYSKHDNKLKKNVGTKIRTNVQFVKVEVSFLKTETMKRRMIVLME